jgi:putative acetyltransferase
MPIAESLVRLMTCWVVGTRLLCTIHRVNFCYYTREQIDAWAPEEPDPSEWARLRLSTRTTFVADHRGTVLGFAEMDQRGGIDRFYCHHNRQRCGIGSLMLHQIERTAISLELSRLLTAASITARPFFEAHGFIIARRQRVVRSNVA